MPRQFIPSVEEGVRSQMEQGVIADYPMVDLRVTQPATTTTRPLLR